ncbi:MAG: hypothetical protein GDYSWBUE_000573, partial [Candidatus Fervidibacterota bacterium]
MTWLNGSLQGLTVERVFDELPQATIVFDAYGIIRYWNKEAERVFGWSAEEAIGRHGTMLVPMSARLNVSQIWRALISGEARHSVSENLTKDGHTIFCLWSSTPLRVGEEVVGVVSVVIPLSKRETHAEFTISAPEGIAVTISRPQLVRRIDDVCKLQTLYDIDHVILQQLDIETAMDAIL